MHGICVKCDQKMKTLIAQQRNSESFQTESPDTLRRSTVFGVLGNVLRSIAVSRVALIPTVHASSVQNGEDASGTISSASDEDDNIAMVKEEDSETGWDRLKEVWYCHREEGLSREVYEVIMMFLLGGMLGFAYGGFPASRHARQRYIHLSQAAIYHSKLEATGSSYNAASRGMIRYGFRWGWRTALLAGGYHGISTGLAIYRNKQDIFCYSIAGVTTGILYRLNLGLRGMVGGAFIGGLLGIPCGLVLIGFQRIMGETFIEKHRRERAERRAERAAEMAFRMQVTPQILGQMEHGMEKSEELIREKKVVDSSS